MSEAGESCRAPAHATLRGVRDALAADLRRLVDRDPALGQARGRRSKLGALLTPQFGVLLLYRLAHALHLRGHESAATLLARINGVLHKAQLSPRGCIGLGCLVPHPAGVSFAATAGRGLTLYSLSVCAPRPGAGAAGEAWPALGDDVVVGAHSVILGPVRIGDRTRVGYAVRLEQDTAPGSLVVARGMKVVATR